MRRTTASALAALAPCLLAGALAQAAQPPALLPQDVPRLEPKQAQQRVQAGEALLVCAYRDEAKCEALPLEGALTLQQFERRRPQVPMSQEIIFYCA